MLSTILKFSSASLLALVSTQTCAEGMFKYLDDFSKAKSEGKATTVLGIDNDTLMFNRSDRFYTSGLRLTHQYAVRDKEQLQVYGWRIGQDTYTPTDIKLRSTSIGKYDHPYSGWLYNGFFKEIHRADGTSSKIGVDVGCMGHCSGAAKVQAEFHRALRQPLPRGWSTQMKSEVGAIIYGDLSPIRWRPLSWLALTPNLHGRFGNIFTDAGVGTSLRAGRLSALPGQSTLHGFLRVDATVVGYNAMLQGGYFSSNNPHTVDPKRWVGEAELGLAWNAGSYGVRTSVVRRSNEIRRLPSSVGAQNFVRLLFSYTP